jgi:putative heme-binding domain-containing protein
MILLRKAQTQEEQLHYVFVLRNAEHGWTLDHRRSYFSWLQMAESSYRGGASFRNFLARIREDAMMKLTPDDKTALADVLEGRRQVEAVETQTTRQFVHNWQWDDLAPAIDQVESGRSFERGRIAYQAAQCYKCHRFAGEGGATGPDLTGVGGRFSPRDLLESVLLPSKVVSDQYRSSIVRTTDGETITGRIVEENETLIKIRTDPFARQLVEVPKSSIDVRTPSPISEMPEGAINVLTKSEILDLVAYLRSGGNAGDKAFRK